MKLYAILRKCAAMFSCILFITTLQAQEDNKTVRSVHSINGLVILTLAVACLMLLMAVHFLFRVNLMRAERAKQVEKNENHVFSEYINDLDREQIETILKLKKIDR